ACFCTTEGSGILCRDGRFDESPGMAGPGSAHGRRPRRLAASRPAPGEHPETPAFRADARFGSLPPQAKISGQFAMKQKAARTKARLSAAALWDYAVKALAARASSTGELRRKLVQRAELESDVEEIISRLREYGYLNDRR